MHNPIRGEATLVIGGRERTLVIDYNALARIEEGLDITFFDAVDDEDLLSRSRKLKSIRGVRVSVAAALSTDKHSVTPDQVGTWLSSDHNLMSAAVGAVTEAMENFSSALRASAEEQGQSQGQTEKKESA